ncbi:ISL3 family transposase [Enterococcus sp. LJL98]
MDNNTRKMLGLTDENIMFSENWLEEIERKGSKAYLIKGELSYIPLACEKCGIKNQGEVVKNGTKTTQTQMPLFKSTLTYLKLKRSRFLCRACQSTFIAQTPIVARFDHLAKELKYQILLELSQVSSRKAIAERYFVSDVSVLRIQEELAETYRKKRKHLPEVLCIDEFKSMKSCEGAMSFICVNGTNNQLFDVLEDRRLFRLVQYFMRFPREQRLNVRYLVMDMNGCYPQLLKTVFLNAEIVTDRFHIVQQITRAFNQLRIKTMNRFNTSNSEDKKKYRRLKRYWKLLLMDSATFEKQKISYHFLFKRHLYPQDIIDELLNYDITLRLAYESVQLLHYHRKEKDSVSFFNVIQTLDSRLPQWFKKKLRFLKKYKQGIKNAFDLDYSNGVTEGLNNKIKVIKRVSYGYRNFYHLRDRIYIIQGLIYQ